MITFSLHTYSPTLPRPYWPLQRQWFKRSVRLSRDQGADSQGKHELTWSYLIPIIGWWLPCHGGSPSSIQHSVVWRLSGQCFLISSGDKCLMFTTYVITNDFSVPGKSNHWRPQWSLREKTPAVDVDSWYDIILLNSDLYCEFTVLSGIALSYLLWVFSSNFTIFVMARILGGISKGW